MNILEEEKIKKTIDAIPSASFTTLEFMKKVAEEFPAEWKRLLNVTDFTVQKGVTPLPPISQIVSIRTHTNQAPSFARFAGSKKEEKATAANLLNEREKNSEAHG